MIVIKDKTKINRLYVPKHYNITDLEYRIVLTSISTNNQYEYMVIDEMPRDFFYTFSIDPSNIKEDGEFKFQVFSKCHTEDEKYENLVSTNLCRIGNINAETLTYINDNKIKYYE